LAAPLLRRVERELPGDLRRGDHALLVGDWRALLPGCLALGAHPWILVRTPREVEAAAEAEAGLWLRGLEAAGEVGPFTALPLIRAVRGRRPFVVEGLGTRAMAASLAVGAAGVVLGPQLWAHGP